MTAEEKQDYGVAVPECIRNGTNYPIEDVLLFDIGYSVDREVLKRAFDILQRITIAEKSNET